jgi:hypothetical protein
MSLTAPRTSRDDVQFSAGVKEDFVQQQATPAHIFMRDRRMVKPHAAVAAGKAG